MQRVRTRTIPSEKCIVKHNLKDTSVLPFSCVMDVESSPVAIYTKCHTTDVTVAYCLGPMARLYSVKIWFSKNAFFMLFFTRRAFIMVKYMIKLVLEFQFDLQNPLEQQKMWIFEKWKIIVCSQSYGIFWPKGDLTPCIIMYLRNIHNMSLVPVTFGTFFFQTLQKWHFLG